MNKLLEKLFKEYKFVIIDQNNNKIILKFSKSMPIIPDNSINEIEVISVEEANLKFEDNILYINMKNSNRNIALSNMPIKIIY